MASTFSIGVKGPMERAMPSFTSSSIKPPYG
eukprot:CAMPEP_0194499524 /NCGR_PEP_ID=MMETSP0253-20130528/15811_1 /TAXON_ID=2966 /ORGANISM="Noctiluca scintillans" /LENGTH=30 /DNA_ID= /DNA_START= /DNA_END= /DNA_ORIENTATION=